MNKIIEVHIDCKGQAKSVGWCHYTLKNPNNTSVIAYSDDWLDFQENFAIDPENLNLSEETSYSNSSKTAFPGVLQDAAPDRWRKRLISSASQKLGMSNKDIDVYSTAIPAS